MMLVFTVFNAEFKEAWRVACLGKKSPGEDPPRPPQNTVSGAYILPHPSSGTTKPLQLISAQPELAV